MKRVLTIVGVILALGGIGATAAYAGADGQPSDACSNSSWTETTVTGAPVNVSVERTPAPHNGGFGGTVCFSDTPQNGAPSNLLGGYANAGFNQNGTFGVTCASDSTADVTTNCNGAGRVTVTDDPSRIGESVTATVTAFTAGATVNQTGAEIAIPSASLNAPMDGNRTSGAGAGIGSGTCAYVNSSTGTCPFGTSAAGTTVNEADVVPAVTTPPGGGCTGVNNTCVAQNSTVTVGSDTSNPTLTTTTPADTTTANVPKQCVQVGATC